MLEASDPTKRKGVELYCPPVFNLGLLLAKSSEQQLNMELRRQPQWSTQHISFPDMNNFFCVYLSSVKEIVFIYKLQVNTFLLFIL